jgi:hypothetical protein
MVAALIAQVEQRVYPHGVLELYQGAAVTTVQTGDSIR